MNKQQRVLEIIEEMASLLSRTDSAGWRQRLLIIYEQLSGGDENAFRECASIFGGMGSINDLVLMSKGVVLKEENDAFDLLRTKLYEELQSK